MLFKLSVTIIEGIMDPAKVTDKKAGAGKIISRIITSLVILALITPMNIQNPSNKWEKQVSNNGILFGALYSLQSRILSNNTIGKLVLGTSGNIRTADEQGQTLAESADDFAGQILRGFYRINVIPEPAGGYDVKEGEDPEINPDYRFCEFTNEQLTFYKTATTSELLTTVNDTCDTDSNSPWYEIAWEKIKGIFGDEEQFYRYSYSPLAGIVALIISVILILYTIDVAIRALKLAILRLIAPIPIISHMSISAKEGKGEDAFSCWVRSLTSTYLELFIRLAIMYFAVYLVNDIIANGLFINTGTGFVGVLSFIFIVIGIFIFARQAPKFIENSLGMKGSAGAIGATIAAAGIGTLLGGGDRSNVLDSMREASRTVQNGGKDPGAGLLKTYRDNQVKKILDKANQGMQNEFYKRGLDIDDQDEIRRDKNGNIIDSDKPNHWWQGKKRSILGFEMGADLAKAQTISAGLSNNQERYKANWSTHERATGRGTTVRGGSEFHTRTDAYPEPTPRGQPGTPPSGVVLPNSHNGIESDGVGGTGYSAGQVGQSSANTTTPSPDVAPNRPYDTGGPGPGGPGGPPPGP